MLLLIILAHVPSSPPLVWRTIYYDRFRRSVQMATTGERVFCGPVDDPFFVDLGGIFDLGDAPRQHGTPSDGLACKNVSTIAIQIPIKTCKKIIKL